MAEFIFKYKVSIDSLIEQGATLPTLSEPVEQHAYRYVFSTVHPNNHKPIYIQKPQRAISDIDRNRLNTSGYALSCYDQEDNAIQQYESLKKTIHNINRSIGDALCYGILSTNDGLITSPNIKGHFDLYEFCECDLSAKFKIKQRLS